MEQREAPRRAESSHCMRRRANQHAAKVKHNHGNCVGTSNIAGQEKNKRKTRATIHKDIPPHHHTLDQILLLPGSCHPNLLWGNPRSQTLATHHYFPTIKTSKESNAQKKMQRPKRLPSQPLHITQDSGFSMLPVRRGLLAYRTRLESWRSGGPYKQRRLRYRCRIPDPCCPHPCPRPAQ